MPMCIATHLHILERKPRQTAPRPPLSPGASSSEQVLREVVVGLLDPVPFAKPPLLRRLAELQSRL